MIQIANLTKRFGTFVAVDKVSLDVQTGEAVALLGPNGSGKTTTLKCLTGLARPDGGSVLVGGIDVARHPKQARALLSFLPQRVAFDDNLTALEVLQFYCRLRKLPPDRIDGVLQALDLEAVKHEPVGQFSGGMVQRLGVAVALLPDAPVLVLDEPAASLDPEGAAAFRELIRGVKQRGRTVLFSTHVLSDVDLLADRAAILVSGKLVAVESVEALRGGLAAGARLRIALRHADERFARVAVLAGASEAELAGPTLWVNCRPEQRLAILRAIEAAGGAIERFFTAEPSLEEIYLRYVNATCAGPAPADLVGLREAVPEAG
ncbi:MAG: ABC transporter ATP-binding protein [Acidobacteriia bacterium]|nr:ABC transporter ATP-binding protein [Terriglobia bacterium]